jgi:hypothetical protein
MPFGTSEHRSIYRKSMALFAGIQHGWKIYGILQPWPEPQKMGVRFRPTRGARLWEDFPIDTLVNIQKTMEHHHFWWVNPL